MKHIPGSFEVCPRASQMQPAASRAFHWPFPPATDSAHPSAFSEASSPASDGLEAIVTVTEKLEELQLPWEAMESESRGAIHSIPIMEDGAGGSSSSPEDPAEAPGILLGNFKPIPCILTPSEKLRAGGHIHWVLGSWLA